MLGVVYRLMGRPSQDLLATRPIVEFTKTAIVMYKPVLNGSRLREVEVVSTVTWRTGSLIAGQRVELVTYLTNIYDTP